MQVSSYTLDIFTWVEGPEMYQPTSLSLLLFLLPYMLPHCMAWPSTWYSKPKTWRPSSTLFSSFNQPSSSVSSASRIPLDFSTSFISLTHRTCVRLDHYNYTFKWSQHLFIWSSFFQSLYILSSFSKMNPKMKSLTIRFQIDHHPFQWLSIDLKVNLEHLTLAYKTLYDLTPGHSSDWSFRWVVVLSHLL